MVTRAHFYTIAAKGYARKTLAFTVSATSSNAIVVTLTPSTAWDGESLDQPTGDGTSASPYQIGTGAELAWLTQHVNEGNGASANAVLTADIDLDNNPWTPMGNSYSIKYKSVFDGQGHTVSGLNVSGGDYAGLFGQAESATIKNVIVQGNIQGTGRTAGLLGYAYANCTVQNCGNEATVTGSGTWTGGIVGYIGSYYDTGSSIVSCYNTGNVTATGSTSNYAGGILGYDYANKDVTFTDCYNAGTITSSGYAGGIRAYGSSMVGALVNCYNVGTVSGADAGKTGAIVPGSASSLTNCYYLSGGADSNSGAASKDASEMTNAAFVTLLGNSAWKRHDQTNGGFPILTWQKEAETQQTDKPVVAGNTDFVWVSAGEDAQGIEARVLTPTLAWDPIPEAGSYTLTIWKEYFKEAADGGYEIAHELAKTLTGIAGTEKDGRLTYDLDSTFETLGESRYYVTVTADGAPTPSLDWAKSDEAQLFGWMDPYNRMARITGLHWEGTKAVWTPREDFDENYAYLLTLYKKDETGKFVEETSVDVAGCYNKLDCSSSFVVGGVYAFTVTAYGNEATLIRGYTDSPESHLSSDARNGGEENGIYTVQATDMPGGEHGADWIAITSAEQWMQLANTQDGLADPNDPTSSYQGTAWGKKYYLANDIDFSNLSADWETKTKSIGNVTYPFMGVLDGNGHKITGLTLSNYDSGLFWYIGSTGYVYDVTIEGANILVSDNASVLAHNNKGTIKKCAVVNSNITADTGAVIGGMVSRNYGVIEDSYVEGGILLSSSTTATGHGGFVGSNESGGRIERCWTSMEVQTQSDYAGGFVGLGYGETDSPAYIINCFALGNVTARSYSGGFVGRSVYENNHYVNCYAAGTVTLSQEANPGHEYYNQELHGFIGGNQPHSGFQYDQSNGVENCWFNAAVEDTANYGAQPKSLTDMATDDFVTALNRGEQVWARAADKNGGLPYLLAVKAPEQAETTKITVTIGLASYDKTNYAFQPFGDAIEIALDSNGNTRVVDVMDAAQEQGLLTYSYDTTPTFGRYIHTINGRAVEAPDGWMFTINDVLSNVSASLATVKGGDKILWYEGTTENHFQGPTWKELNNSTLEWVEISTKEELLALANSTDSAVLAKNYRLTADLDLTGEAFPGIGSADHPFTGIFDGQNHTIANVTVSGTENVGFFNVLKGATVKNLNLTGVQIAGQKKVGGLVGWAQAELNVQDMKQSSACLVGNCTVSGTVSGRDTVGGLVGLNDGKTDSETMFSIASTADQCTADVAVTGTQGGAEADRAKIGGLVGDNAGVVTKSAALRAVNAAGSNMVGGLLGANTGDVYDSHADGDVSGSGTVGGFVGLSTGTVKNSYSLGDVTGTGAGVGGFAGSIGAVDTAMSAGTVHGDSAHGFAGELNGQVVGAAAYITAKNIYGSCVGDPALTPVGNTSDFASEGAKEILNQMTLTTRPAVAEQLYEMFGVQLPVDDDLQAEADKYADSVIVASDIGADTVLSLLKAGETTGEGITVSYDVSSEHLKGGDSLTLAQPNTGAAKTVEVTVKLTKDDQVCYKKVSVVLQGDLDPTQLMDNIAATLTGSSDGWTVMDMVRYAQLPDKSAATSEAARQNALNLLIAEAAGDTATARDRARLEIILRAMGVDSTKLYPANSTTAVNNAQKLSQMDLTSGGYYAAPWLLLADLQGNLKLTADQQNSLITLLKDGMGDGLFGYEWDGVAYTDPDTAGAALAALARYYPDHADAKEVVDTILAALPGGMNESGSFGNANSDAMAIIGLIALGKDPAELKAASGASVVDGLLSHVNSTQNGFLFGGADNALATEQGFRALAALAAFDGTNPYNIYDFSANTVTPGRATGTGQTEKPADPPVGGKDLSVTVTIRTDTADWLTSKSVTVKEGATVYHAFVEALQGTGITQVGAENGYVKSISKDGETLAEFDKGKNSGWLYQVNGVAPNVALTNYTLHDGDAILWYYTTDWTKDPAAGAVSGGPGSAAVDTPKVEVSTDANGQVTAEITLPQGMEQAVVQVPVPGAASGNVAVLIHEGGTQTLLKKSVVEGDTVAVLVDHSCTIKIIDNSKTFTDTAGHWAAKDITFVSSHELFNGVDDQRFAPNAPMDRAMLAAVLYRLEDTVAVGKNPFTDVAEGTWYTAAVTWANAKGIVTGYGSNTFGPANPITREQLATMLYRYARLIGLDVTVQGDLTPFKDRDDISPWADEAMTWAVGAGLINGRPGGLLDPAGHATRAEVAAILHRIVRLIVQ